jgi:hypothetical protein
MYPVMILRLLSLRVLRQVSVVQYYLSVVSARLFQEPSVLIQQYQQAGEQV